MKQKGGKQANIRKRMFCLVTKHSAGCLALLAFSGWQKEECVVSSEAGRFGEEQMDEMPRGKEGNLPWNPAISGLQA